jgi:GAF domain-containing protein
MAEIPKKRFHEQEILDKISKLTDDPKNIIEKTVNILKDIPHYHWVGIYLVEDDTLVLRYYIGKTTEHTRIKIGQGICGAAVEEERTIVVSDVKSDERYIACSAETQSEIVVPIWSHDKIVGEIDIDSDIPDAFNSEDERMLKQIAIILGDYM